MSTSSLVRHALPFALTVGLAGLAVTAAGCSDDAMPMASGAICPSGSTLTYDNFARQFMTSYCTRCHASTLTGAARHGAPLFHDFDTEAGILNVGHHVDMYAAAGPDAVNTLMPDDGGAAPTLEERQKLGEWLACALATTRAR